MFLDHITKTLNQTIFILFRLTNLLDTFQREIIQKVADANALQPKYEQPKTSRLKVAKCRPSRGCCADKKDKHKSAESSDSR